jgi:hypothetical protein
MSDQAREQQESAESRNEPTIADPEDYGHLSVEDDPAGTVDPADLAGTAQPDDAEVAYRPSVSEADQGEA